MSAYPTAREPLGARVGPLPLPQDGEGEDGDKPVAAGKVLGAHLRHLRRSKGLAIKEVAPQIRASISKISRMERGESPPREQDVIDLVTLYGVRDPWQLAEIQELLRQAQARAWWHQYSDVTPGWLRRLIGLEDSATEIRTYEVHLVPGLLQTPDYTRAIVKAGLPHASDAEIKRRMELRAARQQLLDRESRPRLVALLDEGILLRQVGGPRVMCGQMQHLRRLAVRDRVSIRIIKFENSASIGPGAPVTHMTFAAGGPSELIYLEQLNSALYLSRRADVDSYRHVLDELIYAAENRRDSMAMLDEAIARFASADCD
ncbi:helix-turn-helix transcriptional regulator [Streptomyces sp. NPDC004647]|uniref:helix-turn-helix domain-containing protein n=1 Tax=Streptomyces sp. NPDC004647 TaxID=3154671 RepID=UPI0033ACF1CD